MIPFAPSVGYYAIRLASLLHGEDTYPEVKGKERVRTRIAGGMMLSLPVEGGSSVMKRRNAEGAMLADHGRWQDVHLGAFKATYGKTPFFIHLFPEIEKIYRQKGAGSVGDFTAAINAMVEEWLGIDEIFINSLRSLRDDSPERLRLWKQQFSGKIDPEISILDLLFRYGKEGVIALL